MRMVRRRLGDLLRLRNSDLSRVRRVLPPKLMCDPLRLDIDLERRGKREAPLPLQMQSQSRPPWFAPVGATGAAAGATGGAVGRTNGTCGIMGGAGVAKVNGTKVKGFTEPAEGAVSPNDGCDGAAPPADIVVPGIVVVAPPTLTSSGVHRQGFAPTAMFRGGGGDCVFVA